MTWLFSIAARFLPGLMPAFGALLNPWILLAAGGALVGAFLYGLSVGHDRLEAYEMKVAAAGAAQEQRAQERVRHGKIIKEKTDAQNDRDLSALSTRIAALVKQLSVDPGGSLLPAPGSGAEGAQSITFDRAELDRTLRVFTAGTATLVGEGEKAVIDLDAAKRWNAERERVTE
jgi:hypothetical protein